MNKIRFAKSLGITSAFFFLCAAPVLSSAQSSTASPMEGPRVFSPAPAKASSFPVDDFSGFDYTPEQKAEIDRIQKGTKAEMDLVAKDQKLSADQKDAMMLGYSRLEYGRMYTVLTPVQRREVQQKIRARRIADEAARKKQAPKN